MKPIPFGLCRLGLHAICALLLLGNISATRADPSINVWLSAEFENGWPVESSSNRFGCNDKIYAVIDLLGLKGGAHRLQADWTDPGGKIREHVDYPFNGAGGTRITIWLKLHPPKGSALFSFFNPAMGMDDFIGLWELAIRVDEDTRFNTEFEVLC